MRFSPIAVTLLGVIASVAAQYPPCAMPCLSNANLGGCIRNNLQCLCTNQVFISNTTDCINAACNGTDLDLSLSTAREVCKTIGVTLTGSAPSPTAKSGAASTISIASSLGYSALLGLGVAALAISL